MELSIDLLKTFLAVVDDMNYTRAAEKLYKTQSAVSLQMKRLSDEAGSPVFIMKGKKLHLTETGEKLHSHAVRIISAHDAACTDLKAPSMKGSVNLGASEDYATTIIPKVLTDFASKYPDVKVNLQCAPSHTLKEMLDGNELDIAILAEHEKYGRLLKYDRIKWIASNSFVYNGQEVPLAVYPDYCVARRLAFRLLKEAGISWRVAYESASTLLLKAAVETGGAVAPMLGRTRTDGFRWLTEKDGFPELPMIPITLHKNSINNDDVISALEDYIIKAFD